MDYPNARIIVFAKAPVAGSCKTRLAKSLGYVRAAAVHQQLAERTLRTVADAGIAPFEIHAADQLNHPWFSQMRRRYDCRLLRQKSGDLGKRMLWAARNALGGPGSLNSLNSADHCLIIGTDCPVLSKAHLSRALQELEQGSETVLLPSEDGGYALIGLNKATPLIFRNIDWGTEKVMQQTRQRLLRSGRQSSELASVWDVDHPADYYRARWAKLI